MDTTATELSPIRLADDEDIDTLEQVSTLKVRTCDLRPGMVLVDDSLGTPVAVLTERLGARRGGIVEWTFEDLDTNRVARTCFAVSRMANVTVGAR